MTILNIGSVNIDHVYRVAHHPAPGETISDLGHAVHLGGKGANMSLAAALAGADVRHVGCIGAEGHWCRDRLSAAGIDVSDLVETEQATGHAVIMVDKAGENIIVIHSGANLALTEDQIEGAIARSGPDDWLLIQNETNLVPFAAQTAKSAGMKVAYAAAPFDAEATAKVLPHTDLLAVNEVESEQLAEHLGTSVAELPVPAVLITLGARGAVFRQRGEEHRCDAFNVAVVDTTGAGDTFFGYFLASLSNDMPVHAAMHRASAASALQIMKPGAADAIPTAREVDLLLERTDP